MILRYFEVIICEKFFTSIFLNLYIQVWVIMLYHPLAVGMGVEGRWGVVVDLLSKFCFWVQKWQNPKIPCVWCGGGWLLTSFPTFVCIKGNAMHCKTKHIWRPQMKYNGRLCFYCLLTGGSPSLWFQIPSRGEGSTPSQDRGYPILSCPDRLPQTGQGVTSPPPHQDRRASAATPVAVSLLRSRRRTFLLGNNVYALPSPLGPLMEGLNSFVLSCFLNAIINFFVYY